MTQELTPEERAQLTETAAVIEADIRVRLHQTGPVSANDLKEMLIESYMSLSPPLPDPIFEVRDNGQIDVFIPMGFRK